MSSATDFKNGTIFSIAGTDGYVVNKHPFSRLTFTCPDGEEDSIEFPELEQYLESGIVKITGRTRESLEKAFRSALDYSYEANMGDYSMGSINRAKAGVREAREAIEAAGGVIDADHGIVWPAEKLSVEEFVAKLIPSESGSMAIALRAVAVEAIEKYLAHTKEA